MNIIDIDMEEKEMEKVNYSKLEAEVFEAVAQFCMQHQLNQYLMRYCGDDSEVDKFVHNFVEHKKKVDRQNTDLPSRAH